MLTVVAAAIIAGAARLAIKQMSRVVVVVVVVIGEYSIIEIRIHVAIFDNRTTHSCGNVIPVSLMIKIFV